MKFSNKNSFILSFILIIFIDLFLTSCLSKSIDKNYNKLLFRGQSKHWKDTLIQEYV